MTWVRHLLNLFELLSPDQGGDRGEAGPWVSAPGQGVWVLAAQLSLLYLCFCSMESSPGFSHKNSGCGTLQHSLQTLPVIPSLGRELSLL